MYCCRRSLGRLGKPPFSTKVASSELTLRAIRGMRSSLAVSKIGRYPSNGHIQRLSHSTPSRISSADNIPAVNASRTGWNLTCICSNPTATVDTPLSVSLVRVRLRRSAICRKSWTCKLWSAMELWCSPSQTVPCGIDAILSRKMEPYNIFVYESE
jgi:hypothetical protein